MFDTLISQFGVEAKRRLGSVVAGRPEEQLRAPLDVLLPGLAEACGLPPGSVFLVPETPMPDLAIRPDFAVMRKRGRGDELLGFVEIKRPGKGADPRRFTDPHDRKQWKKLQVLPNLIYTDGNEFFVWHDGALQAGDTASGIVRLGGDIRTAGAALTAPGELLTIFNAFLTWQPVAPRNARELARISARLCRLLRDETLDRLTANDTDVANLRADWRQILFPEADDTQFADGYAQAVVFGLLMARARGVALADGIDRAARDLRSTDSLIGTALGFLTANPDTLSTSLKSLTRVLDVVDWATISRGDEDAWLYFYEYFLETYDNALRKMTGSYYTPPEVVSAMVRLTDDALRDPDRFALGRGLCDPDVTILDPAVGTGTFPLGIFRHVAKQVEQDMGAGAVPGVIHDLARRVMGFELQFGPYVVGQLRLLGELFDLTGQAEAQPLLFLTNTLSDPEETRARLPSLFAPLTDSYEQANRIKGEDPITVVIGNPPYKDRARGRGAWVEAGRHKNEASLMDAWGKDSPTAWHAGPHLRHLKNLYVYFWCWAVWKVFGDPPPAGQAPRADRRGIVCFITTTGFLKGPGFQKMRADLRRDADEIWVIDCTPEGHQPPVNSRIFQGVQQPICIVMATRNSSAGSTAPAIVRHRRLPKARREAKFDALAKINLDDADWALCPDLPRSPFLPAAQGIWATCAPLDDLFFWNGSGVMPGRTWVVAPDRDSLRKRWDALKAISDKDQQAVVFRPHLRNGKPGDRHIDAELSDGLAGHEYRSQSVRVDTGPVVTPVRLAYRTLDRQWIIPDKRLINRPNPKLWNSYGPRQIFLTALRTHTPSNGPGLSFCGLIPDLSHYGRVFPLWKDAAATESNIRPAVLARLCAALGIAVTPEDMLAYIAAIAAHPAYTARFQPALVQPGLRLPITGTAALFQEAAAIGAEIIWLHTYGERFTDAAHNRPAGPPRAPGGPTIPRGGAIPSDPAKFPNALRYDAATRRLYVGEGFIDNVTPEVRTYQVSGKTTLDQWFSYRCLDRTRPIIGDRRPPSPLDKVQPDSWPAIYTEDLLNLLHVLTRLTGLEARQADLLERICASPLIDAETLRANGIFDDDSTAVSRPTDDRQNGFSFRPSRH